MLICMRYKYPIIILGLVALTAFLVLIIINKQSFNDMTLESSAFFNNQQIPSRYTCDGEDISPPLTIAEPPPGTESLVLVVDDPDAPGDTWTHWIAWDIDPMVSEVQEDSTPEGATVGTTSFGNTEYGGPCPPSGTHRYFFKLYALDTILGLSSDSKKDEVISAIEGHILAEAEPLIGLYSRQK